MKALTLVTVCLFTSPLYSQDMGGMMAAQSAMDATNSAAAASSAAAMQQMQASQQLLIQQQAQQQAAQAQAEQARLKAQQVQDGQVQLPASNPTPIQLNNQPVAPAVFYAPASGDKTVSPQAIEVEVPVYSQFQPKVQVQKIYTQIKDSQFFLELNPLSLKIETVDFESNDMDNSHPALAVDTESLKIRLVPLDFKFGFENQGWGGFGEIRIADGEDESALTVYSKVAGHKFGAGMVLNSYEYDLKMKRYAASASGSADSTEVGPYIYAAFQLSNDDSVSVEQWNKIGGYYEKTHNGDLKTKGVSFVFHPALDIMFKINPKLQFGAGLEFEYRRFSGDIEIDGLPKYKGIGNSFNFELNLIKTKFVF